MKDLTPDPNRPINVSRRGFLAGTGALVLSVSLPTGTVRAQGDAAQVDAYLTLKTDGTAVLQSPFIEGGQGVFSALAQIVGEELDLDPAQIAVECAPPGDVYKTIDGARFTGGSLSIRSSYTLMRTLGASARAMLVLAAAEEWNVDPGELTTEPGAVVHTASGRRTGSADVAEAAMNIPVPTDISLRDPANFRWIRQPMPRYDVRSKSTGQAGYSIDVEVDGLLNAAVRHAPRLGLTPASVDNLDEVKAMRGVHSVHLLDGAVAVVADKFWQAMRAVQAAKIAWDSGKSDYPMPADFSSAEFRQTLRAEAGPGVEVEAEGNAIQALQSAETVIEADYEAPFLAHGQLEPPSTTARFNEDGTLDLWLPNQAPEMFQGAAAGVAGIPVENIRIHSQLLGGFFGRHFLYADASPFPQAIELARATGRPVKVLWTREEEFLRDANRPMAVARFRGAVDDTGPQALAIEAVGEGPIGRWFGAEPGNDGSAHEGLSGKPYAIGNRRIGHVFVRNPAMIGFWRSVGHSMNDFFYESFLDEMAKAAGRDPFEMRLSLLDGSERHRTLLEAVADLSGGWKAAAFEAEDSTRRAHGVAMASPFGS